MKVSCPKGILKNKLGNLRVLWRLWKGLKNGATGLGWDSTARTIAATEDWWNAKLKENYQFRKFKSKGIPHDIEELLDGVFGGTNATGVHCKSPLTPTNQAQRDATDTEFDCQTAFSQGDGADFDMDDTELESFGRDGGYIQGIMRSLDEVKLDTPAQHPQMQIGVKKKRVGESKSTGKIVKKRNVRLSQGSTLYQEHVALHMEASKAFVNLLNQESCSESQNQRATTKKLETSMSLVENLVSLGLLQESSPPWCFTISHLENDNKQTSFLYIKKPELQIEWLKWEYNDLGKTDPLGK